MSHNNQRVETTQMSINWKMDEQNVDYLYKGILFNPQKGMN